MTYENALEWLADNVPIDLYDDYNDWYNASKKEINTPALWDNPRFNRIHEDYWKNNKEQEPIEVTRIEEIDIQTATQEPIETEKLQPRFEPIGVDLPEKSFVPRDRPELPAQQEPQKQFFKSAVRIRIPSPTIPNTAGFRSVVKRTILDIASFFIRRKRI